MGVISESKRKITLYYNANTSIGKQTFAYVSVSKKKILAIDISKTKVTGTQWLQLAEKLNLKVGDLVETEHPDFVKHYGTETVDFNDEDWIKIIQMHPEVVQYPIVINGEVYLLIKNPSDFAKFIE